MNSENDRPVAKISYQKPSAVDLGPAGKVLGASCVPGGGVGDGYCESYGNAAGRYCSAHGNAADQECQLTGNSADFCGDGSSASSDCTGGLGGDND